jgi:ubiquinone/menaquinone biosynthesis C-methylase UbiE
MSTVFIGIVAVALFIAAVFAFWRYGARVTSMPCPAWLAWSLEIDVMKKYGGQTVAIEMLELAPGMRVADVGCGPGRLTIPIAEAVSPGGEVVALDIQSKMLDRLKRRISEKAVTNVTLLQAGAGEGKLAKNFFDRALLVTVLGEIPDRERALKEIYTALKPGGILVVTEVMGDPHYQRLNKVKQLAETAGFGLGRLKTTPLSFALQLVKPD